MLDFVCFLFWNLALLGAVQLACWLIRCARPDLTPHGTRIFLGLMTIALAFDTALTFLVFADAGGPWRMHNPSETYGERASAYVLAALLALMLARYLKQRETRQPRQPAQGPVEIETSPYSKSTLPM
ncbi:hypothetical protein [Paraburkholderia acidisoli]|uniref:Uncharacterized protein n=1 Tax=Paraburkholderia acidisoli TaxID=2571748 RepID=A0A7Z2GI42_9BURK|nr:hypothetical protein [Paraburkholderia acidisoli]QGZ62220.1 hypothetical protein FAZ98_11045 [Paraburkholderia acidisoli]